MHTRATAIIDFWIGEAATDPEVAAQRTKLWYSSSADDEIRARFSGDFAAAASGYHDDWRATPEGALALAILLDQFSRNLHRGTERAFENDDYARQITHAAIEAGHHQALSPVGAVFLLHPLHHAEDRADQALCVSLYEQLQEQAGEPWRPLLDNFLDYAREHRDIVMRFGRFPHRNRILGRTSTDAERRFLDADARTYGQ